MAITTKDRRRLALEKLALDEKEAREQAQAQIDKGKINNDPVMEKKGKTRLATVNVEAPLNKQETEKATAPPRSLPRRTEQIGRHHEQ